MRWVKQTYNWFERRLQLEGPVKDAVLHPVPRNTASWWYVFGSAAFTLLMLQIVTGILLALVYVPSAGEAWNSLNVLNHQIPLGWFLRAMHGWGSNFMVAIVLIHMAQVFLFGSYKFPRELTWILGVFLLLMTLGMAFTGQVLRFDQDAYWGLGIGASIVAACRSLEAGWFTLCSAARSSPAPRSRASSRCTSLSFPERCCSSPGCTSGWSSSSASASGLCRDALFAGTPTSPSTTN